jgi:glycine cleavage system transcriptional repressor
VTLHAFTVLGHDRPGIIATTTAALAGLGLNLEDSSMTLLRGHFAMTLVTDGAASAPDIEAALAGLSADGSLSVSVHEVPPEQPAPTGASYLLSVHGGDRPGIVSAVTAEVARAGGDITELSTRLAGDLYVLAAECDSRRTPTWPPSRPRSRRWRRRWASGRACAGWRATTCEPAAGRHRRRSLERGGSRRARPRARRGDRAGPGAVRARRDGRPGRPGVVQLAADLVATMRVSPGCLGLAAPQVGVGARVDVSDHPATRSHHDTFVLCNAEVVSASRNEPE